MTGSLLADKWRFIPVLRVKYHTMSRMGSVAMTTCGPRVTRKASLQASRQQPMIMSTSTHIVNTGTRGVRCMFSVYVYVHPSL